MEIKKFGIRFGDNDFHGTFRGVMDLIKNSYWNNSGLPDSKEKLQWLILKIAPIAYISHQNLWDYNGLQSIKISDTDNSEEFIRTSKYLKDNLTIDRILINEELEDYLKSYPEGDNYSTFIFDTTIYDKNLMIYTF